MVAHRLLVLFPVFSQKARLEIAVSAARVPILTPALLLLLLQHRANQSLSRRTLGQKRPAPTCSPRQFRFCETSQWVDWACGLKIPVLRTDRPQSSRRGWRIFARLWLPVWLFSVASRRSCCDGVFAVAGGAPTGP